MPRRTPALLTSLQDAIQVFFVHEAEEGRPAVQSEEVEPAAQSNGSELTGWIHVSFVPGLRAGGSYSILLKAQDLHTCGSTCPPTEIR